MASERIERKLAAIVAADVAGYSRLMAADEEGTLVRLKAHRKALIDPKIAEHGGRIIKTTGDGMLVEFASVVDAVRSVVEIQRGMLKRNADIPVDKRIDFRVGINVGDVIVDGDDIFGDGVNVAARLEGLAEPGGILAAGVVRDQVRDKLSFSFDDLGEREVKNIPRLVRVYRVKLNDDGPPPLAKSPARIGVGRTRIAWIGAAALLIFVAAGGAALYFTGGSKSPATAALTSAASPPLAQLAKPLPHLSIVVLPFTNLSNDPAQDYFADGVTENLTTELSRIRNSFVIARNTAFTYKGKSIDAKTIGKELGVRYVLEGSVQRDQNRVRVNTQLIDAETGAHLWADRFEEEIADLFKLQDQVVARLAVALGYELVKAEGEKGGRSKDPDAIDLTMHAWTLSEQIDMQPPSEQRNIDLAARALFDRALQIDPDDADALAGVAYIYHVEYLYGFGDAGTDYDAKVLGQAEKAIDLAPNNVRAYATKSFYLNLRHRPREGLAAAVAGLAINPNFLKLFMAKSIAENSLGRFEQAKADAQQAMRLSPRDPRIDVYQIIVADAELNLGHLDAAIDQYRQAIDSGHRYFYAYANLAAAYAQAGKMDEAKTALAEARRLNPKITVKWMMDHTPNLPAVFDGLRKAGLAEQ
jgi:adenylate cyclase